MASDGQMRPFVRCRPLRRRGRSVGNISLQRSSKEAPPAESVRWRECDVRARGKRVGFASKVSNASRGKRCKTIKQIKWTPYSMCT